MASGICQGNNKMEVANSTLLLHTKFQNWLNYMGCLMYTYMHTEDIVEMSEQI